MCMQLKVRLSTFLANPEPSLHEVGERDAPAGPDQLAIEPVRIGIVAMPGNAELRHLAGRIRSRPHLSETGGGADRQHAAKPGAHRTFPYRRSHGCTRWLTWAGGPSCSR